MPGFTHPVQDFYLEDVLARLDAPGPDGGAGGGRGRGRGGRRREGGRGGARADLANGKGGGAGARVGPERRGAVEAAILQAFLGGTDADFDHLLEVRRLLGAAEGAVLHAARLLFRPEQCAMDLLRPAYYHCVCHRARLHAA